MVMLYYSNCLAIKNFKYCSIMTELNKQMLLDDIINYNISL